LTARLPLDRRWLPVTLVIRAASGATNITTARAACARPR